MYTFKYENVNLSSAVKSAVAIIYVMFIILALDVESPIFYIMLIIFSFVDGIFFDFLATKDVFTREGSYRFDNTSIYIKKLKGETEIAMDMVDDIIAKKTRFYFSSAYCLKIRTGARYYTIYSKNIKRNDGFDKTGLMPIVEAILSYNPDMKYYPPINKADVHIWKYEKG